MPATIIYEDRDPRTAQGAIGVGESLWLDPGELEAATGWHLEPEGLCRGDACVPLPADGSWSDESGRVDLAAFARREGRLVVRDDEAGVWAFGPAGTPQPVGPDAEAPDFELPDLDGEMHALADYRGRKVFLYTWGSYCGCSFDPPVWETIYQELKDEGLEMISVALDTGGAEAVEERIRPEALDERPEEIRRLRGWSEERWQAKAAPTHPCLIDADHVLSTTYGVANVPMAVWIDEQGRVVRPTEPAGVTDHFRSMDAESFKIPDDDADALVANRERYVDALRDWVRNGTESPYALSPEEVRERVRPPREEQLLAGLHARISHALFEQGDAVGAKRHMQAAVELCPENWTYRRQAMVLDPDTLGTLNVQPGYWEAMDALGDDAFYPPIDLPGIKQGREV